GLGEMVPAQNSIDIFSIGCRYGAPAAYEPALGEKAVESAILANLKLPVVFTESSIWFNNITYTYSQVASDITVGDQVMSPVELHGLILQTGLVQKVNEKSAIQLLFVPRFMTDGINPGPDAWQFGGIAMYEQKYSETLTMRYGLMYNRERSGNLFVPLIDVNWQFALNWSLEGLFPIYLKVKYRASERFSVGLSHFGLITSYELSRPEYAGDYMERTSIDLALYARWKALGNLHLEGRVGYALGRNYEQYHSSDKIDARISIFRIGDNRDIPINPTFNDGPIADLRLVYNLPID
ncbi:MAG TPA: DUF6268 family outer membrane beta-barrel protein, partial [Cryomorphaceae bacterium]|nr:DUF6268 family outer membrane beta-barrel protein [Cryomorphaceae bacterium]